MSRRSDGFTDEDIEQLQKILKSDKEIKKRRCPICGSDVIDQFISSLVAHKIRCKKCNWEVSYQDLVDEDADVAYDY